MAGLQAIQLEFDKNFARFIVNVDKYLAWVLYHMSIS